MKEKVIEGKAVVVKYGNRKLYNRNSAKYVNLTDLLALGVGKFIVLDNVTKQDITDKVVLSALFNQYENRESELLSFIQKGKYVTENDSVILNVGGN